MQILMRNGLTKYMIESSIIGFDQRWLDMEEGKKWKWHKRGPMTDIHMKSYLFNCTCISNCQCIH